MWGKAGVWLLVGALATSWKEARVKQVSPLPARTWDSGSSQPCSWVAIIWAYCGSLGDRFIPRGLYSHPRAATASSHKPKGGHREKSSGSRNLNQGWQGGLFCPGAPGTGEKLINVKESAPAPSPGQQGGTSRGRGKGTLSCSLPETSGCRWLSAGLIKE